MSHRLLESGNRPSVDVGDGTEARLALEALVDSAGGGQVLERGAVCQERRVSEGCADHAVGVWGLTLVADPLAMRSMVA
jgi:hypothetical protein